jgi:hypothetical protein
MNVLRFVVCLFFVGIVFRWVEPFLVMPALGLVSLAARRNNRPLFYLAAAFGWLWQVYIVLLWCLSVVGLTKLFMSLPTAEHQHPWIFYLLGFIGCWLPFAYMLSFERSEDSVTNFKRWAGLPLVAAGFIGFVLFPSLMMPWLWIVRLLGYQTAVAGDFGFRTHHVTAVQCGSQAIECDFRRARLSI